MNYKAKLNEMPGDSPVIITITGAVGSGRGLIEQVLAHVLTSNGLTVTSSQIRDYTFTVVRGKGKVK